MKLIFFSIALFFATNAGLTQELHKPGATGGNREFNIYLPFSTVKQKVNAQVIDGLVIYEGDIILGTLNEIEAMENQSVTFAINIDGQKWPGSIIPYEIEQNHPRRIDIEWAIDHVQSKTNLCLIPKTDEFSFVRFVVSDGCSSRVGRNATSSQEINIGNCSKESIAHEILHAAGLFHEQSREDRNTFVTFHSENVEDPANHLHNFDQHNDIASDLGPYDYGSIMHYGEGYFAKPGTSTLTVNVPPGTASTVIGQRVSLSALDISAINTLYPADPCGIQLSLSKSKSVTVLARSPLNSTGIFIRRGQTFSLSTSDINWRDGTTSVKCDGYTSVSARRYPEFKKMAMIAEIISPYGTTTGKYFLIGCGPTTFRATATGNLVLFGNDSLSGYSNNTGSASVSIKRTIN